MTLTEAVEELRNFLRDIVELNKLLGEEENTDPQLEQAINFAIDDFNISSYQTTYTVTDFPSDRLLIHGAAIQALFSAGVLQSRNRLNYVDAGLSIAIHDKAPEYQGWLNAFIADYERKKMHLKHRINLSQAWDV